MVLFEKGGTFFFDSLILFDSLFTYCYKISVN